MELVEHRLDEAIKRLEDSGEKDFRYEQGCVAELRTVLGLQDSAEKILEAERNPRRSPSFEQ